MTTPRAELTEQQAISAALALASTPGRALLGIAGPPGAGKSTFAELVVAAVRAAGLRATLVPMDGFHLAHSALTALGRVGRKGAPDTFDPAGYVELLRRIRDDDSGPVWAPLFDRSVEDSIAGSIAVEPETDLVVTEGNYLLLDQGAWSAVRPLLDQCWFVVVDEETRRERLQARHELHGRTPQQARERTLGPDEANARLVEGTRRRADALIHLR